MYARLSSFIMAVIITLSSVTCFAASIDWQAYSNNVFTKAKQQHKLVLLFGKAEWCPWCRKMKEQTYTDNSVVSLVNAHYIPVRVDIDNDSSIANSYNISAVPRTIILDANGKTVDSLVGYVDAGEMVKFLQGNVR